MAPGVSQGKMNCGIGCGVLMAIREVGEVGGETPGGPAFWECREGVVEGKSLRCARKEMGVCNRGLAGFMLLVKLMDVAMELAM